MILVEGMRKPCRARTAQPMQPEAENAVESTAKLLYGVNLRLDRYPSATHSLTSAMVLS